MRLDGTQFGSPSLKLRKKFHFFQIAFSVQITANHADFMHFAHNPHKLHEIRYKNSSTLTQCFQIPDHWQRTPQNWSESPRFRAFHPPLPQAMQNLLNLHLWPAISESVNSRKIQ